MRTRAGTRNGFALLMTLMLVTVAGVALTRTARQSMATALDCVAVGEHIQRRWAGYSARRFLLPRAELLLEQFERDGAADGDAFAGAPTVKRVLHCRLGAMDYRFIVTDEQAKVNLNDLLAREGRAWTLGRLSDLLDELAIEQSPVNEPVLRSGGMAVDQRRLRVGGYGQVFDEADAVALIGDGERPALSDGFTLWGDGKLNLRRASPEALRVACEKLGRSVVTKLLSERDAAPFDRSAALAARLDGLDDAGMRVLADSLCDASSCHGLWMIADNGHRRWYELTVAIGGVEESSDGSPRLLDIKTRHEFRW